LEVSVQSQDVGQDLTLEGVKGTLKALISEVCGIPREAIHDGTTIDEDIQMPSVVFVELQVAAEETFDMLLDPVELIELNTFGRIADAIHARIADRAQHR
jgi:acyl carrier protein